MTVSSTTNKSGPYLGNGSTVEFDYEFRILDPSHLTVIMTQGGVDTIVSPSDYTVAGVGASGGGSLTFLVAPVTGQSITIVRNAPFTQPTDLENQGAYYAETVEGALDLGVMRDQQLAEGLSRAVQIPIGADPSALSGLIEDIIRLSDSADEIDVVAGIAGNVTTVAGIAANVTTVAGIAADVTTVAGIAADVTAVADIAADVTVAADNIAAIVAAPTHAAAAIAAEVAAEAARDDAVVAKDAAEAAASTVNLPAPVASTFLQRNSGNTAYNALTAPEVRDALDAPAYCTLAQLPGLDTSKDQLAYVTNFGFANWFQWSSADLSSRTVVQSLTTTTVAAATNICTKVAHLLSTASGVTVTSAVNGLSLNTVYWVRAIDANTFTLHPTALDAYNNTNIFDLTGSTNFTLKHLRDPAQDVYVIKAGGQLDGTAGAWVQSRGAQHLGIGAASYERHFDKALFGGGAVGWLGDKAGLSSTGAGSWMGDEIAPGSPFAMSYLLVGAQVASVCNNVPGHPNCGILGAARTPDGVSGRVGYGISGYFSGHSNGGGSVGWGAYIEGVKRPGSDTTVNAMEIEITNLNSTPTMPVPSPKSGYVQGRTFGILLASGGGNTGGMAYDADWAMFINQNGAKFRTGLIFHKDSLTPDAVTGWQHAIQLPTKARQEWFTSDANETVGFSVTSEVTVAAKAQHIISRDDDIYYANAAGGLFLRMGVNSSVSGNYLRTISSDPGTPVGLQSLGGDANIPIELTPRGAASVSIKKSLARGAPVTKSADFSLGDAENWLIVTKGSSCVVTLPAASAYTGREVTIKTTVAFTTVSASSNVVPLAGGAAGTAILAATAGKWATLVSDGTNWVIMAGN